MHHASHNPTLNIASGQNYFGGLFFYFYGWFSRVCGCGVNV